MIKTARSTPFWIGTVALLAGLLGAGEARAQGLICPTVPPAIPTFNPISCTVNCAQGGTIASALSLRARSTNNFTITINGTCVESVDHVPSGVTLQAGMSGATLQAPSSSTDPVLGISGIGVTLTGLTISGGVNALRGRSGSAFTGNNLLIEGASSADVLLNHSVVTLNTSTIENSANDGIDAEYGSSVFLNGGTVQNNASTGVNALYEGSADVFGGAVLQKNGFAGAGAAYGGSVHVTAATITSNTGEAGINAGTGGHILVEGVGSSVSGNGTNGISVFDGGDALIQNSATISNNSGDGLHLRQGAFAKIRLGASVTGSGGNGIYLESGTVTVGDSAGPTTIQNNKGNGLFMRTNSIATFENPATQIISNTGWGILCTGAPSNPLIYSTFGGFGTVSGNGKGQISCNVAP
jgi:hypothetical protein